MALIRPFWGQNRDFRIGKEPKDVDFGPEISDLQRFLALIEQEKVFNSMNCRGPTPSKFGAGTRIRTTDFLITNEALYQLSYTGIFRRRV